MTKRIELAPTDEHNRLLRERAHPADWKNPTPQARYNLVVIGGGTAGLVSAMGAAGLGAKVALIERGLLGGDCLNFGCVPSKALIRSARAAADLRRAAEFGCLPPSPSGTEAFEPILDFARVMERMRRLRAQIAVHDSAARFHKAGIDVFFGSARFTSVDSIAVGEDELRFARAVIATGSRAAIPDIPGLRESGFLTNETVFSLETLPERLAVLGAGPIGCELAQAFARFGSEVCVFSRTKDVLPKEDPDAAGVVRRAMESDGVRFKLNSRWTRVESTSGGKRIHFETAGESSAWEADEVLVAAGRTPNVEGLELGAAGITVDPETGVVVDDRLRTTNSLVFAAGDVCSKLQFTHAADAMARIVIQNALFAGRARVSRLTVPRCTYTDPEIAHVGVTAKAAAEMGMAIDTYETALTAVDRAVLDGEANGFVRIHTRKGRDEIVGGTIVSRHAGETIGELTLAMAAKLGMAALARTIHPYPTQAESLKKAADAWNRTRLKPWLAGLLRWWLRRN